MEDAAPQWSTKVPQTVVRHLASSISTAASRTVLQPATRGDAILHLKGGKRYQGEQ